MKSSHPTPSQRQSLSRREFVGSASALIGSLALTSSNHAANTAVDRRLTVGFLGTQYSHFAQKYRLLTTSSEFRLVGLCEEVESVRAKGPSDARWLSREQLFAEAEVVVVESAVKHHAQDARAALLAGRHVHVEKPPADSLAAFQELSQLARAKNRFLQVGYMWRHHPGLNAVLTAARAAWLGDIFLVRGMINTYGDEANRREWSSFPGGILFELGCHLIDPLVRLLGTPHQVRSSLQKNHRPPDELADNAAVIFEFERALGIISCATLQPNAGPYRSFEVFGTNGVARVEPLEPPTLVIDLAQAAGPYSKGRQEVPLPPYQRYVAEFTALADHIRNDTPLPVTAQEESAVQATLMRACGMM